MCLRAVSIVLLFPVLGIVLTSCGGSSSGSSGNPAAPSIVTQPSNQAVMIGKAATFTVVASGSAPLAYQWQRDTSPITSATASTYTIPVTALADNGSSFRIVVTNSVGSATSNAATLTVNSAATTDVSTYHNDVAGTGQNLLYPDQPVPQLPAPLPVSLSGWLERERHQSSHAVRSRLRAGPLPLLPTRRPRSNAVSRMGRPQRQ
jgi:Immunoglobulin I-set domain